jgi:Ni/Co efflux regulator RcnB
MRRLLLSAAALVFLAAPALAQSDRPHRGPLDQAQAQQPGVPPTQQQRGGNGGPTSFTDQITGSPPGGQGVAPNQRTDRRGTQPAAQPQPTPQAAPQPQAAAPQSRGDRGNWQGRQGGNNNFDNRANGSQGYGNRGYDNRSGFNGGRRDYRNYNNFHRSFRATRRFRAPSYRRPVGWYRHRWNFGEFLPAAFWARDYWLMDYRAYDLPPPPYGAVWVRVGGDALLVDQDSGEIITVEYDVFY